MDSQTKRRSFEKAIDATQGEYLLTKVLFAKLVMVSMGDKQAFESALNEVMQFDLGKRPDIALVNRVAIQRAKRYQRREDDLFL